MINRKYYIIGCGGLAKEVYFLAKDTLDKSQQFMGFIDYKPKIKTLEVSGNQEMVIDEDFFFNQNNQIDEIDLFFGIGNPRILEKLSQRFKEFSFPNLIHSNFVGDEKSIQMGEGNIITAGCIFTVNIVIGSFNIFNLNSTIGHDCIIRNFNVFNPGVNISGCVNIGSGNLFGTNSTVLQMVQINDGNVLGALSLANKNIESNCIMVGVPARKLEK